MAVAVRDKKLNNAWVSEKVFSPCRDLQTRFSLFVFSITAGLIVSILIRPTLNFLDFEFDWCQFYFDCPVLNFERCPCLSICGCSPYLLRFSLFFFSLFSFSTFDFFFINLTDRKSVV